MLHGLRNIRFWNPGRSMPASSRANEIVKIGDRLRAFREALELSQSDLARAISVRANTYNQWENGKRLIDPLVASRLCDQFGVTMDWIYRGNMSSLPQHLAAKLVRADKR